MPKEESCNPFMGEDGFPMKDKANEFFEWARAQELERRKSLSQDEVANLEASEQALARRMNS
jgi:hypothetical protein